MNRKTGLKKARFLSEKFFSTSSIYLYKKLSQKFVYQVIMNLLQYFNALNVEPRNKFGVDRFNAYNDF